VLRDLPLLSVYDSSEHDLVKELFIPLLSESQLYQRGVGFFTSGWLRSAARGITNLAARNGKAYLVTSPILEPQDWEAILNGELAKNNDYLLAILRRHVHSLEQSLEENTRAALAWMIADGLLEIRFAIPKHRKGDFHDKFAVFVDEEGNRVAIHGSYNDSIQGSLNGESFSVFRSWIPGQREYVEKHQARFTALWEDRNPYFDVYEIPEAIKESVIALRGRAPRPYVKMPAEAFRVSQPRIPSSYTLYGFQADAIDKWFKNGCRGIFAMATGTGKTITALAAAVRLRQREGRACVVVIVPFVHLLDQWLEDLTRFKFVPFVASGDKSRWLPQLKTRVVDLELGFRQNLCILATHDTAATNDFRALLSKVKEKTLLIADEVHYLGARTLRGALIDFKWRLGLSATPQRWYDPFGTQFLLDYFGGVVFTYDVKDAIENGFLTPYEYRIHFASLNDDECTEFRRLTAQIAAERTSESPDQDKIDRLSRRRAKIVSRVESKHTILQHILEEEIRRVGRRELCHTLVYCAPGQSSEVVRIVSQLGLRAREFVHTVSRIERRNILSAFDSGDIQVLVAIKCLDEGVNIPPTRTAIIMASTTNPREFIQRLGRVLRLSPGKTKAVIHDFLPIGLDDETTSLLLRRELPRFAELTRTADNGLQVQSQLQPLLIRLGLVHLAAKRPWEIYQSALEDGLIEYADASTIAGLDR